jgi:predicted ATPase
MHLKEIIMLGSDFPTRRLYPFDVPAFGDTVHLHLRKPVVFFVGENGTGKSTFLEAITRRCGAHIWHREKRHIAHCNPYETHLADYLKLTWTNGRAPVSYFRAETFHAFADFLDDVALSDPGRLRYHGGRILNTLSHGEKIQHYFRGRFHTRGLYIIDEPETALSPNSQLKLLGLLQDLVSFGNAQFLIASHSPILLSFPNAQIFSFDDRTIKEVTYEETAHFRIYAQFFSHRAAGSVIPGLEAEVGISASA